MKETLRQKLHKYIDTMEEYQLNILLGFLEKLFPHLRLDD